MIYYNHRHDFFSASEGRLHLSSMVVLPSSGGWMFCISEMVEDHFHRLIMLCYVFWGIKSYKSFMRNKNRHKVRLQSCKSEGAQPF